MIYSFQNSWDTNELHNKTLEQIIQYFRFLMNIQISFNLCTAWSVRFLGSCIEKLCYAPRIPILSHCLRREWLKNNCRCVLCKEKREMIERYHG